MEQLIKKEEINRLINIKGEIKGLVFKSVEKFVLKEEGNEGLKKLEETMVKLGYPIEHKKIKVMNFYPLGLASLELLVVKALFQYDDKKFEEMGSFRAKSSLYTRIVAAVLISPEKIMKEAQNTWRRFVTIGNLKIVEYDLDKKYAILRLENYNIHQGQCRFLMGFFSTLNQIVVKSPVTCKETKCFFRGDDYHEFLMKW